mgnify:CR=1 FL=1
MGQVRKTRLMRDIEHRLGEPIEALLKRLYVDDNLTMREVARSIGVRSDSTIWLWLLKFGIPARQWMLPEASAPGRKQ